jgi:hypothetical protein
VSERDEPRPDDEPLDDDREDGEPGESSTFVGEFSMPVDPNADATVAALEGMAKNIRDAAAREAELGDLQLERERDEAAKRRESDGRSSERRGPKQKGIPKREFFWIIERRLENSATHSREWLAQQTKERSNLEYVPRDRLSPLVDWIDLHPEAAERSARLRVIPSEFPAGTLGPIPPRD